MSVGGEHNDVADLNRGDGIYSQDALVILQTAAGNIEIS
jgi:hypothetical protein